MKNYIPFFAVIQMNGNKEVEYLKGTFFTLIDLDFAHLQQVMFSYCRSFFFPPSKIIPFTNEIYLDITGRQLLKHPLFSPIHLNSSKGTSFKFFFIRQI